MIKEFGNLDRIMLKLARHVSKLPVSPNQWTLISIMPAIAGFFLVIYGNFLAAFVAFLVSGGIDGIDGAVSRYRGTSSALGAFIDGTIDRFVDFIIIFSFLFMGLPDFLIPVSWWVAIAAYWALVPTFIVAYANHREAVNDPKEKVVWRIFHRVEMYALWLLALLVVTISPQWALYILVFTAVLSVITAFQSFALAIIKSRQQALHLK